MGVEGAATSQAAAGAAAGVSRDADGDDGDGRRRRRGGRRRRGRDRDDGQVDGAPGDAPLAEDDGHEAHSDDGEASLLDAGDRDEGGQEQGDDGRDGDGRDGDPRRKRRRRGGKNRRSRVDIPAAEGSPAADDSSLAGEDRDPFEPEVVQEEGFQVVDDARDADIDGRFARLYASQDDEDGATRGAATRSGKDRAAHPNADQGASAPDQDAAVLSGAIEAGDASDAGGAGVAGDDGAATTDFDAAMPAEEEEELTDVLALAEAEAARLASSDGNDASDEVDMAAASTASAAPSNRFVIDLRSSGST